MHRTKPLLLIAFATCSAGLGCSLLVPVDDYASGGTGGGATASTSATTTSSSGTAGEGGGGEGGSGGTCNSMCRVAFTDNFEDSMPGPNWQVYDTSSSTIEEIGGELVITIDDGYAAYKSVALENVTDCCIVCEVPQSIDLAGEGQARLRMGTDDMHFVEFLQTGDTLAARGQDGGAPATHGSDTYSASAHRWWRIRESRGNTHWETSATGTEPWAELGQAPTPISLGAVRLELSANAFGTGPYGAVHFDNFNLPPH